MGNIEIFFGTPSTRVLPFFGNQEGFCLLSAAIGGRGKVLGEALLTLEVVFATMVADKAVSGHLSCLLGKRFGKKDQNVRVVALHFGHYEHAGGIGSTITALLSIT